MKKKQSRKYTKKFKIKAIEFVLGKGGSIYGAAKELDMPKSTLAGWIKKTKAPKPVVIDSTEKKARGSKTELEKLKQEMARLIEDRDRLQNALNAAPELAVAEPPNAVVKQSTATKAVQPYDETMLDCAREYWKIGDWDSLVKTDKGALEHHPDRAKLALLVAAGYQQKNDLVVARHWMRLAQEWGCDKKLVARLLIAGVHNTLGRAAVVCGQEKRAFKHFDNAISTGMPGGDIRLVTRTRIEHELGRVGFRINQPSDGNQQFANKVVSRFVSRVNAEIGFNRKHRGIDQLRQLLGSPPVLTGDGDNKKHEKNSACFGKSILIVGMRHSGSTALFNIVRIALIKKQVKFSSHYSENEQQKKHCNSDDQLRLVKTHEFRDDLIIDAAAILSTRRDIRDTVASASRRKFFLLKNLGGAIEYAKYNRALHDIWLPYSDYCFVYEEFISDPITAISAVLAFLGAGDLDPREIFEEIRNLPTDQYDTTLLSPSHITDPERKSTFHDNLDSESLVKINSNHAAWLSGYGYCSV